MAGKRLLCRLYPGRDFLRALPPGRSIMAVRPIGVYKKAFLQALSREKLSAGSAP
jgi:hypothetical protein